MNGKVVAFLFLVACCLAIEVSASVGPQCLLPLVRGPCRGMFKRYGYNPETHQCEEFTYGGCGGNQNNYMNRNDCRQFCA
ncbi:PI-actitoxin-Aeq3a-like [Lasioglossum baleicum]|uniref:PI-actitoxin-Aeq3a-like n=1 Tax=Lasioglossum baleicum TaxID=434251 RepID=UPI003FCE4BAC